MKFTTARSILFAAGLSLAPWSAGCAATARQTYMEERAGQFVYERPIEEVWPAAKKLLSEEGYSGREAGGLVFVTEWDERIPGNFTRYLLQGQKLGPSRSSVRFLRNTRGSNQPGPEPLPAGPTLHTDAKAPDPGTPTLGGGAGAAPSLIAGTRDLTLEWKLLERVEPARAAAIQAEAKAKYP